MVNTGYLHRRLFQNFARAQAYVSSSVSYRSPTIWVRAITNTPPRATPSSFTVSFGAENDALLAPHLQRLKEKEGKARSKRAGRANTDNANDGKGNSTTIGNSRASVVDDFEIDEYVDLSVKKSRQLRTDGHQAEVSYDAGEASESPSIGKRRLAMRDGFTNVRRESSADKKGQSRGAGLQAKSRSETSPLRKKREPWQAQKNALDEKFGETGWNPRKKLSPDAIEGIRGLHKQNPVHYSTEVLSTQFKVSPEAIRRILRSKWSRTVAPDKMQERRERWARRHDRIWDRQSALGLRPERVKDRGIEDPDQFEKDLVRRQTLGEI